MNWLQKRIFTPRKITLPVALSYGVSDLLGGSVTNIFSIWLLFFYTTYGGITVGQAGIVLGIAKIVDAIQSPIMGAITDNFHKTKLGQKYGRRHFFMFTSIPLVFTFVLIWLPHMNVFYYAVTYILYEMTTTIYGIAFESLPTEMTTDFEARTKLSTARMWSSSIGAFLATFLPSVLIAYFGKENTTTFVINAFIFACIFATLMLVTTLNTWEKKPEEILKLNENARVSLRTVLTSFWEVLQIRAFRKHLAIYLLSFTGKDLFNTVFVYFCVFCLGISSAQAGAFFSLSIVGLGVTIIAGFIMAKKGPRILFLFAHLTVIACVAALCIIYAIKPPFIITIMFVVAFFYQTARVVLEFTPWNVFPFVPDVDLIATKQIRTGIFGAIVTFCRKLTNALAVLITGVVLSHGGFVKGHVETQSIQAQHTILYILIFGTGGLVFCALLVALTFRLDKRTHKIIHNEIHRLSNGGSLDDVTPETKEVVEDLTGFDYKDIWGHKNKV